MEKTRTELEQNVSKLRASLRHWQQWEIEYEGMKEELLSLNDQHTQKDLRSIERSADDPLFGESDDSFLNFQERKLLMYTDKGRLRQAKDIVGILSRRIDYVQQSIKTLVSLLNGAEAKLASSMLRSNPEIQAHDGLPLTEIHEELDEEGNVISSSLSRPDEENPRIQQTLRKIGLHDSVTAESSSDRAFDKGHTAEVSDDSGSESADESDFRVPSKDNSDRRTTPNSLSNSSESSSRGPSQRPAKPEKRVSFADGTKAEPATPEHPKTLDAAQKRQLLQDLCAQVREELQHMEYPQSSVELASQDIPRIVHFAVAQGQVFEPFLKSPKYREVRRLLKAEGLNLWEASRLLCLMTKAQLYDISSPEIVKYIGYVKQMYKRLSPPAQKKRDDLRARTVQRSQSEELLTKESQLAQSAPDPPSKESSTPEKKDTRQSHFSQRSANDNKVRRIPNPMSQKKPVRQEDNANNVDSTIRDTSLSKPLNDDGPKSDCENPGAPNLVSSPVIPERESPEDAALRRQMLRYNMNEVGAVVAELNLDDDTDDDDEDDDYDDQDDEVDSSKEGHARLQESDDDNDDDDDDDEDEHGRSSSRFITEDYLTEMQALEQKLQARAMINAGPNGTVLAGMGATTPRQPFHRTSLANGNGSPPKTRSNGDGSPSKAKGVRFAEELDIQSPPKPGEKPVIERSTLPPAEADAGSQQKKVSRFKAAQQVAKQADLKAPEHPDISNGPSTKKPPINASTIVERPYNPSARPPELDDLDPALLQQQVSNEYHRLRNRMIQREGGFTKPDERAEVPVDELPESEGGTGRKMSRFKAARLGGQ